MDYFALRMGEVRFRGWEIAANLSADADTHNITAADLRPSLQQKGVDMRIGLDIASLTLKETSGYISSRSVSLLWAYLLPLRPVRYILIFVRQPLHLEQGSAPFFL